MSAAKACATAVPMAIETIVRELARVIILALKKVWAKVPKAA